MRRSPMGLGAIAVGLVAGLFVLIGLTLSTPHMMAGVGLVVALSGIAVAREGRRVEEHVSPTLQRWGLWVNAAALTASVGSILIEVVRR